MLEHGTVKLISKRHEDLMKDEAVLGQRLAAILKNVELNSCFYQLMENGLPTSECSCQPTSKFREGAVAQELVDMQFVEYL